MLPSIFGKSQVCRENPTHPLHQHIHTSPPHAHKQTHNSSVNTATKELVEQGNPRLSCATLGAWSGCTCSDGCSIVLSARCCNRLVCVVRDLLVATHSCVPSLSLSISTNKSSDTHTPHPHVRVCVRETDSISPPIQPPITRLHCSNAHLRTHAARALHDA